MGDLLKEAIADAKKVKATAIANARQTILETFQPSVQRLVSTKIAEEDGDEELEFDINSDGSDEMAPEAPSAVGFGGAPAAPVEEPMADELPPEDDSAMELEALIRELDAEEDDMLEGNEEDWADSAPTAIKEENDDDGGAYTQAPPPESGKDSIGDLNEQEIDEVLSWLGEEDCDDSMEEINEDEGYDDKMSEKNINTESYRRKIRGLQKQLRESYQAITILKKTINEVNLLNAKLMYSQKLFHKLNLSESQKVKVLESFDRATTIREVKGKYVDIMTLINRSKPNSNPKSKMTEGAASKPIKQLGPKKSITEQYQFAPRWRVLAGMEKLDF